MRLLLRAAGLAFLLAGCADMQPFDPPVAGEMNPEPGLFSGPSGEFVLFRQTGDASAPETTPQAPETPQTVPPPSRRKLTDPPPP